MSLTIDAENPVTNFVKEGETTDNAETWQDERPSPMFNAKRIGIAVIGVLLGLFTMFPNVMIAATSEIGANVGMLASFSFMAGGVYGGLKNEPIWLLPGFILQLLAFLVLFLSNNP
jgi:hypothetical protein